MGALGISSFSSFFFHIAFYIAFFFSENENFPNEISVLSLYDLMSKILPTPNPITHLGSNIIPLESASSSLDLLLHMKPKEI